ncbi:MAG: alpha/beta hydrolase [Bacteroidaceae bacterium]
MKTKYLITACFLIILFIDPCLTAAQNSLSTPQTYIYAQKDSSLYLDVYKPVHPREDKACVVILFGGGFYLGSRDNLYIKQSAEPLVERGFTVISIDYRLGLRDRELVAGHNTLFKYTALFRQCIDLAVEDCSDAIAWICSNADMLDINTNRIVLTGNSAGAVTVLELDHARANSQLITSSLPQGWMPAAVVPYAGGLLCRKKDLKYKTPPAPTLLFHGTKDKIVSYKTFGMPFQPKIRGANKIDKVMDKQKFNHWIIRCEGNHHEVSCWLPGSTDIFCSFVEMAFNKRPSILDATLNEADIPTNRWTGKNIFDLYLKQDSKRGSESTIY